MFGQGSVTSSWANPQGTQTQGTSGFGQPTTFGSGGGAFGQQAQQQPQQPAANPMFGSFGASTSTAPAPSSGFGAFGGGGTTSAFGAPKPTTGFGAFGGGGTTSAFGSGGGTGAFGSGTGGTSGTGAFGQPAGGSAFGSTGGGVFGQAKPTTFGATGFGTTNSSGASDVVAPVTTGTANPPFSVYTEKDSNAAGSATLQFHSISAMAPYRGTSFEELRVQDYQQNRKTASTTSGFGSSAFGTTAGGFGQSAQPTQSGFGGGGAFGSGTGTGAFGGGSGTGAFGSGSTGTGAFGGGGTTSGFGQTQTQTQPTTNFGGFGQPSQGSTGTGAFGASTGTFGAKPAGGFGASAFGGGGTGTSTFGQPAQTGAFGQPTGTGAFGSGAGTSTGAFGQPAGSTGTGAFGSSQPASGFGTFGSTTGTGAGTGAFGQPAQSSTGTGIFGQSTGGAFGAKPAGGLFGQSSATGTGIGGFGQPAGSTGLFGSSTQPGAGQQPGATGFGTGASLFGKPAGTGTFGGFGQPAASTTTQPSGGLFGGGSTFGQSAAQPTAGTGLFGGGGTGLFGKPAGAPAMGSFGSQSTQLGANQGASMFGASTGQPGMFGSSTMSGGAQGMLTASINQPIGQNLPLFSMLPQGPRAVPLDSSSPKKKAAYFVDVPTRSPVTSLNLGYQPTASKLRGFGSSTNGPGFTSGNPQALLLSTVDTPLRAGTASPSLGSGSKASIKKLVLDKKIDGADLFGRAASASPSAGGKILFNPTLSHAARDRESKSVPSTALQQITSPSPAPPRAPAAPLATSSASKDTPAGEPKEGEYWVKPDLNVLIHAGHSELAHFPNLIVGRVGYGEIHFLDPVDLTGLSKLSLLLGNVIIFDKKECSVYPEDDDSDKPVPGEGLNVRARIILYKCWVEDKATREPIKDEKHPAAVKHLKYLQNHKATTFESFDISDGKWVFVVDHF